MPNQDLIIVPDQELRNTSFKRRIEPLAEIEVNDTDRVKNVRGNIHENFSYVSYTNTYVTNKQINLKLNYDQTNMVDQLMSSYYSVATLDGFAFAMCHIEINELNTQDKANIKEIVDYIARITIEKLLEYKNAHDIYQLMPNILLNISDAVKNKYPDVPVKYNLIFARSFKEKKDYRLVGANVGTTSCFAYHPVTKTCTSIAPGIFDEKNSHYPFNLKLIEGSYIFPVTTVVADNLFQHQLTAQKCKWFNNKEMEKLFSSLSNKISLYDFVHQIMKEALQMFEAKRASAASRAFEAQIFGAPLTEDKMFALGGDCLIAGLKLPTKKEQDIFQLNLLRVVIIKQHQIATNSLNNANNLTSENFINKQAAFNIEKCAAQFGYEPILAGAAYLLKKNKITNEQKEFVWDTVHEDLTKNIQEFNNEKLKNITKNTTPQILLMLLKNLPRRKDANDAPVFTREQLENAQRVFYTCIYEQQLTTRAQRTKTALVVSGIFCFTGVVPLIMYAWWRYKKKNEELQARISDDFSSNTYTHTYQRLQNNDVASIPLASNDDLNTIPLITQIEDTDASTSLSISRNNSNGSNSSINSNNPINLNTSINLASVNRKIKKDGVKTFLKDGELRKISINREHSTLFLLRKGSQTKKFDHKHRNNYLSCTK